MNGPHYISTMHQGSAEDESHVYLATSSFTLPSHERTVHLGGNTSTTKQAEHCATTTHRQVTRGAYYPQKRQSHFDRTSVKLLSPISRLQIWYTVSAQEILYVPRY